MKVLMLSKACIVGIYQRKLEQMAALAPDMQLTVCVPPSWRGAEGETLLEQAHTQGYDLRVLPIALNGNFHAHFYPGFAKVLRELQPDLVHIDEEPYNLATYHANVLSRRKGIKTLWFSWQNLNRTYPPPFSWMERYNVAHSDHAIVGSHSAAQVWREKGYASKIAVIPQFGVDPVMFSPEEREADRPVRLAFAGRLVPEKGVDIFVKALEGLKGNWEAVILGNGPELPALQAQVQTLELKKRVSFQVAIPSTQMPSFYSSIDVLVLPSRRQSNWVEQFGRALVEAMACGACVIGSQTGEIPFVIGDAGFTFPENDVNVLHEQLQRLVDDVDLRVNYGLRGRERVLAQFTQSHIAQATLDVYKEILQ